MSHFIISAPSGAGKTTLTRELLQLYPNFRLSVSSTTRPKRSLEEDGKDYYFITEEHFKKCVHEDEFLEYAHVYDHYYGTLVSEVDRLKEFNVIFDVDVSGMRQIKSRFPDIISIFILPPSYEELERRLIQRNQDSTEVIHRRLIQARLEMSYKEEYDYVIVNDNIPNALRQIRECF